MSRSRRADLRRSLRADARFLVAERVHAIRHTPYELLSLAAELRPRAQDVSGLDGAPFRRQTTIRRLRYDGGEELHILIRVSRRGPLGRLKALAEELLVATPDGRMQREWSLPGDQANHRPFRLSR